MSGEASSSRQSRQDDGRPNVDLSSTKTSSACRPCRTRRIKCVPSSQTSFSLSADQPQPCTACVSNGKPDECIYPPSKDRAAFSRQYVQNLEARVQALEILCKRLEEGATHQAQAGGNNKYDKMRVEGGNTDPGVLVLDDNGYPRWSGIRNAYSSLDTLMVASMSAPSLPPGLTHYIASTNAQRHNGYFGPAGPSDFMLPFLPSLDSLPFPDHETAEALVNAYYSDVDPLLPITPSHRIREFLSDLSGLESRGGDLEDMGSIYSLLYAVFALGERVRETDAAKHRTGTSNGGIWNHLEGSSPIASNQASQVWADVSYYLFYTTSKQFNHVKAQCTILLSVYYASVSQLPRAWSLAGQASRYAQDCGDHRNYSTRISSFQFKQVGRRDWWAIYSVDRLLSMMLGRNFTIEDEDTDAPLPLAISDRQLEMLDEQDMDDPPSHLVQEPANCTLSGFIAMVKLSTIAGRITRYAHRRRKDAKSIVQEHPGETVAVIQEDLEDWFKQQVPSKYKTAMDPGEVDSTARPVKLMAEALHHTYYAVTLALYSNIGGADGESINNQSVVVPVRGAQVAEKLLQSIRSCQIYDPPPTHLLAVYNQYVWSAGITLLAHRRSNPMSSELAPVVVEYNVGTCRDVLRAQTGVYPGAKILRELLDSADSREKAIDGSETEHASRPTKRQRRDQPLALGVDPDSAPSTEESPNDLRAAKLSFIRAFHNRRVAARKEASDSQMSDPFQDFLANPGSNTLDVDEFFRLFQSRDHQDLV